MDKSQIEKIKITNIKFTKNTIKFSYEAKLYLKDNSIKEVSEDLFFDHRTDLLTAMDGLNYGKLRSIGTIWSNESEYLDYKNAMFLQYEFYRWSDLNKENIDEFYWKEADLDA